MNLFSRFNEAAFQDANPVLWREMRARWRHPIAFVLVGCGYWSLYLLPGLLPCLFGGVSPETALATVIMIFSQAWLCANIGLFWSAVLHKSATATNWTIISVFLTLFFAPFYVAWHASPLAALGWALAPLIGGELLYLATHRILRDAPRER